MSKVERGLASPSLLVLTRIVQALDLRDEDLFGLNPPVNGRAQVIRASTAGIAELFVLQAGDTLIVPPLAAGDVSTRTVQIALGTSIVTAADQAA